MSISKSRMSRSPGDRDFCMPRPLIWTKYSTRQPPALHQGEIDRDRSKRGQFATEARLCAHGPMTESLAGRTIYQSASASAVRRTAAWSRVGIRCHVPGLIPTVHPRNFSLDSASFARPVTSNPWAGCSPDFHRRRLLDLFERFLRLTAGRTGFSTSGTGRDLRGGTADRPTLVERPAGRFRGLLAALAPELPRGS
jgi:hypothetical protein